jgi:DNA-binding NtrC family response regulator
VAGLRNQIRYFVLIYEPMADPPLVLWTGAAPPDATAARLRAAGFRLGAGAGAIARVLATRRAVPPPAPAGGVPWIWVSGAHPPLDAARRACGAGAYDVIWAADPGAAERLARRLGELAASSSAPPAPPEGTTVVADSAAARLLMERAWRAARTDMPVLLIGETGTGKEVVASLIHAWSGRAGPFVPINCAAIPNELMESELFGHARGAFSGAVASVDGKLLAARAGTVFLDEIDDTPLATQVKLLRVLEDGQVTRVGETAARATDFRLIAATNRDLEALIAAGRFGQDFYERLAIVRLDLPPLRARREDVVPLARHFMRRYYERQRRLPEVTAVAAEAAAALERAAWPGNIRQLRNVVYQALTEKRAGDELLLSDLRPLLDGPASHPRLRPDGDLRGRIAAGRFDLRGEVRALEAEALRIALELGGGSPTRAARLLGTVGRGSASDPSGTVRAMMRRLRVR